MSVTSDTPIALRFREIAAAFPDTHALVGKRRHYTYAELDRWSDAIAAELTARALPSEHPVAIVVRDPLLLVPATLAVIKAGHFFLAVDATDSEDRIAALLDAAGASLCLTDSAMAVDRPRLAIDSPSNSEELGGTPTTAASSDAINVANNPPHALVQLVFTSGTTGAAKAVAMRQRFFVERVVSAAAHTGRAAGERVSYTALPGFARATGEILGSLLNGATLCAFDARTEPLTELAAIISRERVSILTLTPALFRRFIRTLPVNADLSTVRKLRLGADIVTLADVDAWRAHFPNATLERAYNSTETGLAIQMSISRDTAIPGPLVPIGRARPDVELQLLDEAGAPVDDGVTGELIVRSRYVAHGYWNAPELTAARFTFDPRDPDRATFRTGDLLRRDADGLYYFVGRADSRLKIHGRRIDPAEIEQALIVHGGVREAAVVGKEAANGELVMIAYVVAQNGASLLPRDLRAALRAHMPLWMIPRRVHHIEALPMTRSGKVDRFALQMREEPRTIVTEQSRDALERQIAAIWSRVIGADVGTHDDFFDDLGGDSLMAAHLTAEVNEATGRSMPLSLLIEMNTVARMAEYLRASPDVERTAIQLQAGGSLPPLFCVTGKGGSAIQFRLLAEVLGPEQPFYGLTHHGLAAETFPNTLQAIAACYIDVMRAIQPAGPYYVAGYSAGGFIAHEIARQLWLAGDHVAFLGLIDSAADRELPTLPNHLRKQFRLLRRRPRRTSIQYAAALVRRSSRLAAWLVGRAPSFRSQMPPAMAKIVGLFESIDRRETLQRFGGRATLFRAIEGRTIDNARPDFGWRTVCDELEIVDVVGDHETIFTDDVEWLAAALRDALAKAR